MSRKPESVFIESVHRHLPVDLYRMKNHNEFIAGIADVWYSGNVSDLWLEYKFLQLPVRDQTVIDLVGGKAPMLSLLQQQWLRDRGAEGRNVGVIVGCKEGGVWFEGSSWQKPLTCGEFRTRISARPELARHIVSRVSK